MGRFGGNEGEPLQFDPRTLGKLAPGACAHWGVKIGEVPIDGGGSAPVISGPLYEEQKDAQDWLRD